MNQFSSSTPPTIGIPTTKDLLARPVAISLENVGFAYPNNPDILQGVSFSVREGERVGLIGHNGCGKTTLFMLMCGMLKPQTGDICLFDRPVQPGEFRPEVGFLFQDPEDQLFSPSVRDDVAFGPQNLGLSETEVAKRVEAALELTGTQFLEDRPPHHLSGGEKQMVAIAGLLAMCPRILLYDEPTASLDLRTRRRLIRFLQQSDETLVLASHDLEFLLEVCDRIILLDEGCVIADGDPVEVMGNQTLMENHGLEKPHSLIPHVEPHHVRPNSDEYARTSTTGP
ncbi:energy-coupling factor ABC transporter ATP-binding protein [Oscillatoria sp. CS-180]|uniref:energy-coupling factor ABC transporter ATP-binding protein n=1 Tax=Oscillatoria sp. CS-180 TaxID=3021720 RepID=UPI00232D959F|nr:energy-coupling factor ABC transporter ATP-binding protein [Oscillatoria sp. CS-180]MDB9525507.1 energy-coupling factor ABC transporter ATP-binding protein [Oscillatoria sp. CS-180]